MKANTMLTNQPSFIEVGQLRIGLYVHLDLGWMDHPFTLSNFKVKDEEQIAKIKKTGLKKLRYDPNRSDCEPLPHHCLRLTRYHYQLKLKRLIMPQIMSRTVMFHHQAFIKQHV